MKQRYAYRGEALRLGELYATLSKKTNEAILGSVRVTSKSGIPLKIVFVRNRNTPKEWLSILTTDIALEDAEIVRIYGMRWNIESFYKVAKSYLKLSQEFEGKAYVC
jgi:IS4 transposase